MDGIGTVALIIAACVTSNGVESCKEYRVPLIEGVTRKACERHSMIDVAQWSGEHPHLNIRKWKCVDTSLTAGL